MSSSDSSTSDVHTEKPPQTSGRKRNPKKSVQATDDLVSVTVRKSEPNQRAGVSLAARQGSLYITKVIKDGLFYNSEVEIGDLVLSINGSRLKKGEGAQKVIKQINSSKATVTMVVKKSNKKTRRGTRSLSPRSQRKRKNSQKVYRKVPHRNPDGR